MTANCYLPISQLLLMSCDTEKLKPGDVLYALKNFAKFTGNTCVGVSFLIKLIPATSLKRDSVTGVFL